MLKQRILTALILLPLMIVMLFYAPAWLWSVFCSIITLLALWEFSRMCKLPDDAQRNFLIASAVFMLLASTGNWQLPTIAWLVVFLFWLLVMPLWLKQKWTLRPNTSSMAIAWLMLMPFWFALIQLRPNTQHAASLLAIMVLVWIADTAAYFVGRAFGKHPLAPVISPKKSWEGVLGALIVVLIYLSFARNSGWIFSETSWFGTMVAGVALTFVSIGGDLLESWLKRAAGIKDSSNLLPGHGGVYDRIDSLIAVLALYVAVGQIFS